MKISDKIAIGILSLMLAIFVFVASICMIISNTFFNPDFMVKVLKDRDYYSIIYTEYCESIEDGISIPAGVDTGVLSSVISKDRMMSDINSIIYAHYDKNIDEPSKSLDYDGVKSLFYDTMVIFFTNKGAELSDEMLSDIMNVASHCSDEYKGYAEMPFIGTIGSYSRDLDDMFLVISIVCCCLALFLTALLIFTKKWRSSVAYTMGISMLTAGLLLTVIPAYVLLSNMISYLRIGIESLYNFAIGYANSFLLRFVLIGLIFIIIGLIIGFVLFILPSLKRKYKKI